MNNIPSNTGRASVVPRLMLHACTLTRTISLSYGGISLSERDTYRGNTYRGNTYRCNTYRGYTYRGNTYRGNTIEKIRDIFGERDSIRGG